MKRRPLLKRLVMVATSLSLLNASLARAVFRVKQFGQRYLRPPGALPEDDFVSRCIRCNQCAEICPNNCIKFFGPENGLSSLGTPYITPREKACILWHLWSGKRQIHH